MTKIYTRTGDTGETGLFGGGRVPKDAPRVTAYGELDELNATLGMARCEPLGELDAVVQTIQNQLFTVGAILATPRDSKAATHVPAIEEAWVSSLEQLIDGLERELPPLRTFILPGGCRAAAALHLSRTVCRRVERRVVPLVREGQIDARVIEYLNRLSDLLFVMARAANARAGQPDVLWSQPPR